MLLCSLTNFFPHTNETNKSHQQHCHLECVGRVCPTKDPRPNTPKTIHTGSSLSGQLHCCSHHFSLVRPFCDVFNAIRSEKKGNKILRLIPPSSNIWIRYLFLAQTPWNNCHSCSFSTLDIHKRSATITYVCTIKCACVRHNGGGNFSWPSGWQWCVGRRVSYSLAQRNICLKLLR